MRHVTKELIDQIASDVSNLSLELHLKDEVLAGLVARMGDTIITNLNTLWFYGQSLEHRANPMSQKEILVEVGQAGGNTVPETVIEELKALDPKNIRLERRRKRRLPDEVAEDALLDAARSALQRMKGK